MFCFWLSILFSLWYPSEQVQESQNLLINPQSLISFYKALSETQNGDDHVASVVHIGDSHIQADYFTGELRRRFQSKFGNAGRGLVFPYKIAKSYGSQDLQFSHEGGWDYFSVKNKGEQTSVGLSGYTVLPHPHASLLVSVEERGPCAFNKLTVWDTFGTFLPQLTDSDISWERVNGKTVIKSTKLLHKVMLKSTHSAQRRPELEGLILERKSQGVIYHSIGINGATTAQYLRADFESQLVDLDADIVILSFGTNDCYTYSSRFCLSCVKENYRTLIKRIRKLNPSTPILLTSPADHFFKRRYPNSNVDKLRGALKELVEEENIALWDLYTIMGGKRSILTWKNEALARNDLIHFTKEGYQKQGDLLFEAFMNHYQGY